jgi:hypothetical protein
MPAPPCCNAATRDAGGRTNRWWVVAQILLVLLSWPASAVIEGPNRFRLDLMMIVIDDLRSELGCYGCAHMVTPAIDRLAAEGMTFDRMHVSVGVCAPSRTAILTSRRPDTSRVWKIDEKEYWRDTGGNCAFLSVCGLSVCLLSVCLSVKCV